jgi:hypothetical protein
MLLQARSYASQTEERGDKFSIWTAVKPNNAATKLLLKIAR